MDISELAVKYDLSIIDIIEFFDLHHHDVDTFNPLTAEQVELFNANIESLKQSAIAKKAQPSKIELDRPKIEPLKVLGKIDLNSSSKSSPNFARQKESLDEAGEHEPVSNTPRLMAAAKEFNISKYTLIDFLVAAGFNRDDLKPTAKLAPEMYMALRDEFLSDKVRKLKSKQIDLPKGAAHEERNHLKGIVHEVGNGEKVKIAFIKYERIYKNGKPVVLEKSDKARLVTALKEHWGNYKFIVGEKVYFSLQQVNIANKIVRVAMPPNARTKQVISESIELGDAIAGKVDLHSENTKTESEEMIPTETTAQPAIAPQTVNQVARKEMNANVSPLQKILFGSPGTGKSFQIVDAENSYFRQLFMDGQKPDLIKTVFHPEYTYGDFMGKLMPLTNRGKVEYRYYAGHFMLALGTAYKNIIKAFIEYNENVDEIEKDFKAEKKKNKSDYSEEEKVELQQRIAQVKKPAPKNVLLVIDEINRGNSAAIFGTVFQLLDRDNQGWSSYPVKISDLELKELLNVTGLYDVQEGKVEEVGTRFCGEAINRTKYDNYLKAIFGDLDENKRITLTENNIKMPPNLSIIATMNTSDNSIYFMDSAFKRRWDWEFIDITSDEQKQKQSGRKLEDGFSWDEFVDNLNAFIKKYGERIRKIEDKQIGYYFIKGEIIRHEAVRNKLMFFLWDSIFNNDKKPIRELLGSDKPLVTFGDFIKQYTSFIEAIKTKSFMKDVL